MEQNENERAECYGSENWRADVAHRMRERSVEAVSMREVWN